MGQPGILIAEDDTDIVDLLQKMLLGEGYQVFIANDGATAISTFETEQPHLVILDLGLPEIDGIAVCKKIRENGDPVIIMLTARTATGDQVEGLDAGADDYITKPFRREELLARIRSQLRRNPPTDSDIIQVSDLQIDRKAHAARRGDRELELTRGEYQMLSYLVERTGQTVSREEILQEVWGWQAEEQSTNTINMFVSNLRKKMEAGGEERLLKTRHGVGYFIAA